MKQGSVHSKTRWMVTLLIALAVVVQSAGSAWAAEGGNGDAGERSPGSPIFTEEMEKALEKAEPLLYAQLPQSDWAAVALALNGKEVPDSYLRHKGDELLDNRGKYDKVSELTRSMAGYAAAGGDVTFIAGLDLYPVLMNHPGMEAEGVPGLAVAYRVANRSMSGTLARTEWYPDLIYYKLVERQAKDGSWALSDNEAGTTQKAEATGSVTATSLALTALAEGAPDSEEVRRGLEWLKAQQTDDGGFGGTSDTALAVIALSALRIDAATWTRADGSHPLRDLLSRQTDGGRFAQDGDGAMSLTETTQAYLALTVYKRFANGEAPLNAIRKRPVAANGVKVSVEGPEGTIAQGRGQSGEGFASALAFLDREGIAYKLNTDPQGGKTIDSIAGIAAGRYGAKDGWKLAARSKLGTWMFPENFPGLSLADGDELLVYYGSDNTAVLDMLVIEWNYEGQTIGGSPIPAGKPFRMEVKKANRQLGYLVAQGVTVRIGGQTAVSDAQGKVSFGGLTPGVYRIETTAYRKNAVPTVAKGSFPLHVSAPELSAYKDEKQVSSWARDELSFILREGYMEGVDAKTLAPKQALTRAQYVVLLLRLLEEAALPKTGTTFSDVAASAWYSGALAKAAKLGITDRSSGAFEPNRAITREEAAIMAANAGRLATYGSAERMALSDIGGLSAASRQAIQAVFEHSVMTGSDGKFHPRQTLVREQAAAILARLHAVLSPYHSAYYPFS
ncbi:S-layer homology domain-containing protein [Cohnella cellulosilytica]|uniref:S-layer homology domain-containing protein n=1 Tax=Cohnella cellulosilytica TaxID=986710 RepID=A0ABW2FAX2_9BACL